MPQLKFHKYQGTGNDFVMIDDSTRSFDESRLDLIKLWCDRNFGVGADGVILIRDHLQFDFEMVYFNPDGSQSLCGNGSRCAVKFAHTLGLVETDCKFLAVDGAHCARIEGGLVFVKMHDVEPLSNLEHDYFVDTGSPHHVRMVSQVSSVDVRQEGKAIRNSQQYQPNGANVNFVEPMDKGVFVRTYERGVEDETLSCGTGVTAVALVLESKGFDSPVTINTKGGELAVSFEKQADGSFTEVYLSGPAIKVFEGVLDF